MHCYTGILYFSVLVLKTVTSLGMKFLCPFTSLTSENAEFGSEPSPHHLWQNSDELLFIISIHQRWSFCV